MEESENQAPEGAKPTKKEWYKKKRYWILIAILVLLAGMFTLVSIATKDVPMCQVPLLLDTVSTSKN